MDPINAWIICLLGVSLVGIAWGQGSCYVCTRETKNKDCKQKFYPSYNIDDDLCDSLKDDENIEKTICKDFDYGYKIFCEQAVTEYEFECKLLCPPPPVIQEKYYGGTGATLKPGVTLMSWFLLTLLTWFQF